VIRVGGLAVESAFRARFTVRRPTVSLAHVGEVALGYRTFEAFGSVQPAKPDDVKLLPGGTRLDSLRVIWCKEELRAADGASVESDVIVYKGESFRVVACSPRAESGFFRAVAEGFVP